MVNMQEKTNKTKKMYETRLISELLIESNEHVILLVPRLYNFHPLCHLNFSVSLEVGSVGLQTWQRSSESLEDEEDF